MSVLTDGQKITLRAIQIGGVALSAGQLMELETAMTDGIITLDNPATADVNESEITDSALLTALTPFNNNTPADNVIDGGDTIANGTPSVNGAGATDLFAAADITAANGWVETAAGSGIFVNSTEHKIYIGDAATGTISIATVLGADAANSSQYTVIMDDDNGNTASVTVDCAIDELIVDNDMLNATGGEAKATVTFTGTGSVKSIWNDVDAIRADINTSITGLVIAAGGAGVKNTNDLDISETISAQDSNSASAKTYNVTRVLNSAGGTSLIVAQDDLNITGEVKVVGSGSQISNSNFGQNIRVNVTDNRNFTALAGDSRDNTRTNVNLNNVIMSIDGVKITTAAANGVNAGNIFSLNLNSQGEEDVTYGITGKVSQSITNCDLGDETAVPPPPPPEPELSEEDLERISRDPYNILEINVTDGAKVSTDSVVNVNRSQNIENINIGSGVGVNVGQINMPFINGTYVDQEYFGGHTAVSGSQTVKTMYNASSMVEAQIRNENIWLGTGESEAKYRAMSFEAVQELEANQFFAGGSQSVSDITGNYKGLNNGKDSDLIDIEGLIDIDALIAKMQRVNDIVTAAATADFSADGNADVSAAEFSQQLADSGLTPTEITALYNQYAGGDGVMTTVEYGQFITAISTAHGITPGGGI